MVFYATLSRPASVRVWWTDLDQSAPSMPPHPPSFVKIISHLNQEESLGILDSRVAANILNRSFRRLNHCC